MSLIDFISLLFRERILNKDKRIQFRSQKRIKITQRKKKEKIYCTGGKYKVVE